MAGCIHAAPHRQPGWVPDSGNRPGIRRYSVVRTVGTSQYPQLGTVALCKSQTRPRLANNWRNAPLPVAFPFCLSVSVPWHFICRGPATWFPCFFFFQAGQPVSPLPGSSVSLHCTNTAVCTLHCTARVGCTLTASTALFFALFFARLDFSATVPLIRPSHESRLATDVGFIVGGKPGGKAKKQAYSTRRRLSPD